MELLFLAMLVALMAFALGSGFPVAFALPGAALVTFAAASGAGWLFEGSVDAYFASGGPSRWLSAGVTNFRGIYWEVERDTLIAIPLFIFMGIMLQRSKIAEDLLVTMAQLFGPVPGGLGISVVFVGALLAATTGIVGATVVAMGLISLPAMLRNNYSVPLATGTISASGTLGQIIPPSIVLIILADQLSSAVDQAGTARQTLYREATGSAQMPGEFGVVATSAGDMFLGAFIPGLVLVGLYMAYILIFALLRPSKAPAVHYDGAFDARFWGKVAITLVPPLTLIFLVLGSIIGGIATVNQAGAIGAAGALIMAGYRLREGQSGAFTPALIGLASIGLIVFATSGYDTNIRNIEGTAAAMFDPATNTFGAVVAAIGVVGLIVSLVWSGLRTLRIDNTLVGVMIETAKTTSLVFIILLGAAMLTSAFRAFGGEELVKGFLESLPGGFWTQFVIVMIVIFVLGFFLDFIEIAVVVVPIVAPILLMDPSANITAGWLGVMIGLNIQTSFLTPPFGFALFYLRGVAPAVVKTLDMYKGVIAFITLQLIALVIVGLTPGLVNYLPNRVSLLSDSAPPPNNPRLQLCLEEFVAARLVEDEEGVRAAIARARTLDLSTLPEDLAEDLTESFDAAEAAFERMAAIQAALDAEKALEPEYRPLHVEVRAIEREVRRADEEIEHLEDEISDLRLDERVLDGASDADRAEVAAEVDAMRAQIAQLELSKEQLIASIPSNWEAEREAFLALIDEEQRARRAYRRTVDDASEPLMEILALISPTVDEDAPGALEQLQTLDPDIRAVEGLIRSGDFAGAIAAIESLTDPLSDVEGGRDVRSPLGRARRSVRGDSPDPEEALEHVAEAVAALDREIAWRTAARAALYDELSTYERAIEDTIALRAQDTLPREQALFIAGCNAQHRDLTLQF